MTRALSELKLLNVLDPCCERQPGGSDVDPGLHFVMKLGALGPGGLLLFPALQLAAVLMCSLFCFVLDGFGRMIVDKA